MKRILYFVLVLASASVSQARNFDGCYQLLDAGVMYPAICLSGTNEEGIAGAGARLAIFGTNSNKFKACLHSTRIQTTENELIFEIDGRSELVLNNFVTNSGTVIGDAKVGSTSIKFVSVQDDRNFRQVAHDNDCY